MATKGKPFSTTHKESLSRAWARMWKSRCTALKRGWEGRRLVYGPIVSMTRREISHRYGQRHKDRLRYKLWQWRKANPHKLAMQNKRNKARRRGAIGRFTTAEWNLVIAIFRGKCAYCWLVKDKLEPDHVFPVSKGGSNFIENIVPACRSCNSRKGDRVIVLAAGCK